MSQVKNVTIDDLLESCRKYLKKDENLNLINRAYNYALLKHTGQFRKSGEPYIIHPLAVAYILSELSVEPVTIAAALLHDTIEDTEASFDDIKTNFSEDIAYLVEGVTKINQITFDSKEQALAETHQKMLLAMANDIRIILIKLADRLHNMRTMDAMPREAQIRKAKETLEIYAPLAHKLGMFKIKAELEDRALRYENPDIYYHISNLINAKKAERENLINEMIHALEEHFKTIKLKKYEIKGRIKNIYSIYKKMYEKNREFDDIYDLLAIRIIVDKVETCYQALGIIHAHFVPLPKRFKDYIAVPKPNLYQSLHTTVVGVNSEIFEIQIRTKAMDDVAEVGIAAHWAYKENKTYSKDKVQFEMATKLKWYGELLMLSKDQDINKDAHEFVDAVKTDLLDTNIYVFTPKGEVIALPNGATVLDYAYKIHTDVGNNAIGATINNKNVVLDTVLKTGDVVNIRTQKNSAGPSEDWLKKVTTSHAKAKIKNFLNNKYRDELIERGKEELEKEIIAQKVNQEITGEFIRKHFQRQGIEDIFDLYVEIGKKIISPKTVVAKLLGKEYHYEENLQKQILKSQRIEKANKSTGIIVSGVSNADVKLGNCCNCIPGDPIVGYISKGNGVIVHSINCKNIKELDKKRFVEVYWEGNSDRKYSCRIKILSENNTIFADLISTINASNSSILQLQSNQKEDGLVVTKIKILVRNIEELDTIIANLNKIKFVMQVERDNN
ncbi:MAG: bifunctional (p)ppGpp synthetase/guanosine-3',5'-bis(diphosphate) 3'-pyrophosphohydrolase [bacterium]|nr:bifunctional (p)ppGpp synthetase/guanosine-3',5'-bis(diphosphate) 3'-pyrophosphohydrolase [bacterium]